MTMHIASLAQESNIKLVNIFSRDQIIVLCQQPSFVLHSSKTKADKDVFFTYDVIENLDYMDGVNKTI